MLEKLRLRQFFCCCTIRTGSLVIGTLGWLGTLTQTLTIASSLKSEPELADTGIDEGESNSTSIVFSIIAFCLSVALVWGIYQNDRKFFLPWLVLKFLECGILTIISLIFFFAMFVTENGLFFFLIFLVIGLLTALFWYCWLCVWSLYQDLGETTQTIIPMAHTIPMTDKSYEAANAAVAQEMV